MFDLNPSYRVSDLSWDHAEEADSSTVDHPATVSVERCLCPEQYAGLSCQVDKAVNALWYLVIYDYIIISSMH